MTYYIFITGCQQNIYDSERIAHLLAKMGYVLTDEKHADLIMVLSCSVRQKPIDRIWGKLRNWHKLKPRPKIIATGCLLPADKIKMARKIDAFIPIDKIGKELPKFLNKSLKIKNLKLKISAKSTAFVPIMFGCDNFCSYCAVPYTRGRERSRSTEEILCEIERLVKNGVKEITLLGQNVNSYKDKKIGFANLLKKIEKIKGLEKISFLTCHPKDVSDDLIDWMAKSKKFSRELHLPLQSGDDKILRKMNRGYTSAQYLYLIENCKLKIENLRLTTDVIVGFPGETPQQFNNTVKLCQKIGFDKAYVSQYSPRPSTAAAKMTDNMPPVEKKRRWKILDKLINKKRRVKSASSLMLA